MEHINAVGCSTHGLLVINGSVYPEMPLPEKWSRIHLPKNLGYCGAMNWCFKNYPDEKYYGMMGDDEIVKSKDWDTKLIDAAGDWHIAHSNDGWQSHRRVHGYAAFGGELIRTMGYMIPQGIWHWYSDNVWEDIAGALGIKRMVPDVITEHKHYISGKAPKDKTYELGESRASQDEYLYHQWRDREFVPLVAKIRKAMGSNAKVVYE